MAVTPNPSDFPGITGSGSSTPPPPSQTIVVYQNPMVHVVASVVGGTLLADFGVGLEYDVKLDTNLIIGAPSVTNTQPEGTLVTFVFRQDATGGRHITAWNAAFLSGVRFQARQGPSQASSVTFRSNGDNTYSLVEIDGIDIAKDIDVRDFGAKDGFLDGGSTDCSAPISNAIAFSATLPGLQERSVFIPDGFWQLLTGPIIIKQSNIRLKGQSKYNTILSMAGTLDGPHIAVIPASSWTKPTIGAALATGNGGSWPLDGTGHYWVAYSDTHMLSLNGLSGFCVEAFVKISATTPGNIIGCRGGVTLPGNHFNNHITFHLHVEGDDGSGNAQIRGRLDVGGSLVTVTGSTGISLNAVHHLALTFDGSTLRLFQDGVQAASQAASGSVTSYAFEQFVLGPELAQNNGTSLVMAHGLVDGIRVSKAARYTTGFTAPTAKPTIDSNTLFTHNFDLETANSSDITLQQFSPGAGQERMWCAYQRGDNPGPINSNIQIDNMTFSSSFNLRGGVQAFATSSGGIYDIQLAGGAKLSMENNCFEWDIRDIYGNSGSAGGYVNCYYPKHAVYLQNASGAGTIANVNTLGYVYPLWISGSSTKVRDVLITPTTPTIYCAVALAYGGLSEMTFDNFGIDDESSTPNLIGGVFADSIINLNFIGGGIDLSAAGGTLPPVTVSGFAGCIANLIGTMFGTASTSTNAVHSPDALTQINILGCSWLFSIGAWSDDAAHTLVFDGGSPSLALHSITHASSPVSAAGGGTWLGDASGGAITYNLPAASSRPGLEFVVKKTDSSGNAITVTRAGSDHIDGATTFALSAQYKFVRIVSDGSANWNVVGSN